MPLNCQNEHEIHKQKTSTNQKIYSNQIPLQEMFTFTKKYNVQASEWS
jgi:hypothetical protein